LLEREDVKPNLPDRDGQTPLLFAASEGDEGVVKLLLERADVSPNSPDVDGRTPLSLAASEGHEGIVKLLLERPDVIPDLLDNDGRTPLSFAILGGREAVVKLLLESRTSNCESPKTPDRLPTSVICDDALYQETTHSPTAPEDVTLCTADVPPLHSPIS